MGKLPAGYVKVQKVGSDAVVTVMRGVPGGHVLAGRSTVPVDDSSALNAEVRRLVDAARAADARPGRQADGNR